MGLCQMTIGPARYVALPNKSGLIRPKDHLNCFKFTKYFFIMAQVVDNFSLQFLIIIFLFFNYDL